MPEPEVALPVSIAFSFPEFPLDFFAEVWSFTSEFFPSVSGAPVVIGVYKDIYKTKTAL